MEGFGQVGKGGREEEEKRKKAVKWRDRAKDLRDSERMEEDSFRETRR